MPTTLVRKGLVSLMLLALVASTGCIEFERAITVNKDLSGTAKFRMTMNMEPMAQFAAQMARSGAGKSGPPTQEEIAEALKGMNEGTSKQQPKDLKQSVGALPPGFTLVDVSQKLENLKMTMAIVVGFDDIRKLPTLKFTDVSPTPGAGNSGGDLQPFEGVEVKDEGKTILITAKLLTNGDTKMMAPKAEPGAAAGATPPEATAITDMMKEMMDGLGGEEGLKTMVESMMKDMKETFRVESPLAFAENNATRRDAGALIWEQSMEAMMKAKTASANAAPTTMSVRIRK